MIIVGSQGVVGDIAGEIARLEQLLLDLEDIADGLAPTAEHLATAPFLDNWVEVTRPDACLAGKIKGHPICHGPISITSGLIVWAPEFGWARTLSRFYRLGHPLSSRPAL